MKVRLPSQVTAATTTCGSSAATSYLNVLGRILRPLILLLLDHCLRRLRVLQDHQESLARIVRKGVEERLVTVLVVGGRELSDGRYRQEGDESEG